jgi:hypothetical protein
MATITLGTVKYIHSKECVLWNNDIDHEDLRISMPYTKPYIYLEQHMRAWEQTVKAMLFDQHFGRSNINWVVKIPW